jgi:hypothetical protein
VRAYDLDGTTRGDFPHPAAQMSRWLLVLRRSGCPTFDRAWHIAWNHRTRWPHDFDTRQDWKRAVAWARPFYERAWYAEPIPDVSPLDHDDATEDPERRFVLA